MPAAAHGPAARPAATGAPRKSAAPPTAAIRRPAAPTSLITGRPVAHKSPVGRPPVATATRRPAATHSPATAITRHPATGRPATTHKHVTGWPHHHGKISHPTTTHRTGTRPVTHAGRPVTHTGRTVTHTGRPVPYRPGRSTVHYTQGAPGASISTTQIFPGSQPMGQPVYQGTTTPAGQSYPTGYGCSSSVPGSTSTTAPGKPCHNCGTSRRGCTTLSRFAFNSAELKSSHKAQIRQMAERILQQNSNAVIATGHTDHTGTEDYNEALGERRAAAVVKELKKQMSLLKPGSQKLLFYKIDSKGETKPVSQTDTAANRRVAVCVRKGSFIK
jgi:peptidoglycan-associated lipoprotein